MEQYHVYGKIRYMLRCPKAPGVDLCDPPQGCPGHEYPADVDLYVDAPDEQRAEWAALKKLATAYPWPVFDGTPEVEIAAVPTVTRRSDPPGPALPGFEGLVGLAGRDGIESVTLSHGDRSVTLTAETGEQAKQLIRDAAAAARTP